MTNNGKYRLILNKYYKIQDATKSEFEGYKKEVL